MTHFKFTFIFPEVKYPFKDNVELRPVWPNLSLVRTTYSCLLRPNEVILFPPALVPMIVSGISLMSIHLATLT